MSRKLLIASSKRILWQLAAPCSGKADPKLPDLPFYNPRAFEISSPRNLDWLDSQNIRFSVHVSFCVDALTVLYQVKTERELHHATANLGNNVPQPLSSAQLHVGRVFTCALRATQSTCRLDRTPFLRWGTDTCRTASATCRWIRSQGGTAEEAKRLGLG